MCGICGKLIFDRHKEVPASLVESMLNAIRHRGPDDEGIYTSSHVGLGHRRLSIIGLSTGHQPLSNEDGTVWITFNGEIYNYAELRVELIAKGHRFVTETDTEVIVHLYEEFGDSCVEKLRGMFAFAIWDDREKVLLLARDRVGIKPLYYLLTDDCLIFGSEIKAILADPEVDAEILPAMIDRFLTFFYLPGEETLLKGIRKLAPGSVMLVRGNQVRVRQYWDLQFTPANLSLDEAEAQLMSLLEETVQLHMISDVPVGFLLSGGVDSTAMLSMASEKTSAPLSSYTVGFSAPGIEDERPYARLAAGIFGSQHHEMTITAADFAAFMPRYVWHMEEPVCEPPAVALYYVSELARKYVKVLISGEGGDEAFGGYPNYRTMLWIERAKAALGPLRGLTSAGVSFANRHFLKSGRIAKYAPMIREPFDSYYYGRTSSPHSFFNASTEQLYAKEFAEHAFKQASTSGLRTHLAAAAEQDTVNRMLYVDTKMWLPDDLLLKADKMTMANSIELRVPFLDHKILEFAASLPGNFKVRGLTTKYVAKRALNRRVPSKILNRKKAGFPVPYDRWLRTDLKSWLTDILMDRETLARGYFERGAIEKLLAENSESGRYSKEVFSLVTLELWHRAFLNSRSAPEPCLAGD